MRVSLPEVSKIDQFMLIKVLTMMSASEASRSDRIWLFNPKRITQEEIP